jgi:IS1 family transposase
MSFKPVPAEQLELSTGDGQAKATNFVRDIKLAVVAKQDCNEERRFVTFKLDHQAHGALLQCCKRLGITMTDLFSTYVDKVLPVLRAAEPVEVKGYKPDGRTFARQFHLRETTFKPVPTKQLGLTSGFSKTTKYVRDLKLAVVAKQDLKGNRRSVSFKLEQHTNLDLLECCITHGITKTDLFSTYIDKIIPVLRAAEPIKVEGYNPDGRTTVQQFHRREPVQQLTA